MAAEAHTESAEPRVVPRLRKQFDEVAAPALTEQFGYKNRMQVPKFRRSWSISAWARQSRMRRRWMRQ